MKLKNGGILKFTEKFQKKYFSRKECGKGINKLLGPMHIENFHSL